MSGTATPRAVIRHLGRVVRRATRWLAAGPVLVGTLAVLTAGAAYTSVLVAQRQNAPSEASRYNVTWVVAQTGIEFARLQVAVGGAALAGAEAGRDEVQLRFDILANRVRLLLEADDVREFIRSDPEFETIVEQLKGALAHAQPLVDRFESDASVRRLHALLAPLNGRLARLTSAANTRSGDRITDAQKELNHLYRLFQAILVGLVACGVGMVVSLRRQNADLRRAHARAETMSAELRHAGEKFDAALNNMSQGLCMADADQHVLVCNRRFVEMFGLAAGEARVGVGVGDLFRAAGQGGRFPEALVAGVEAEQRELALRPQILAFSREGKDGSVLAVSHRPMPGGGWVATYEDATARARMEKRLQQGQRMEAVGQLTAGVAHDFNNMLQVLLGGLELALDEDVQQDEARQHLQSALQAGRHGARLTSHLLSFSRQQALRPAALDLPPLLDELARTLSRTLGQDVALRVEARPGLPCALADAAHLDSALLNLALNARDAMPRGGELRIEAYPEGGRVVVAVSDTGEGMAPEVLARVCEPFFTTKGVGGSGLGLPMVQGFAHQSGGELAIQSAPGRGTRVELRLPVATSPVAAAPRPTRQRSIGRGRVLVVDDDADVGRIAAAFLSKAGFAVTAANGADEALAALGIAPAYDALVTDFAMPGMDGADLVLRARELQPALPAVLITGHAGAGALERLPGDVAILRKPFQEQDLARKVKALVEGAAGTPSPAAEQLTKREGVPDLARITGAAGR